MSKKTPERQEKLDQLAQSWSRMFSCISHDLTTPLAILRMNGNSLEKILPSLYEGYRLAVQHHLMTPPDTDHKRILKMEGLLTGSIEENIDEMQKLLNTLHPYNKQLLSTNKEEAPLSAKTLVERVLKNYPFSNEHKNISIKTDFPCDFILNCAPVFAENLLTNLLSNALNAIHQANQGDITIWTEETNDYGILHMKDTGGGMNDSQVTEVFKRFFSKREDKIIPGLGFCRLAFLQRGGDVLCQSAPGSYTEFNILSLK